MMAKKTIHGYFWGTEPQFYYLPQGEYYINDKWQPINFLQMASTIFRTKDQCIYFHNRTDSIKKVKITIEWEKEGDIDDG